MMQLLQHRRRNRSAASFSVALIPACASNRDASSPACVSNSRRAEFSTSNVSSLSVVKSLIPDLQQCVFRVVVLTGTTTPVAGRAFSVLLMLGSIARLSFLGALPTTEKQQFSFWLFQSVMAGLVRVKLGHDGLFHSQRVGNAEWRTKRNRRLIQPSIDNMQKTHLLIVIFKENPVHPKNKPRE